MICSPSAAKPRKVTVPAIRAMKGQQRIGMLTAYDFPSAKAADDAGTDMILVGDSLGMVVLGYDNTLPVTLDEIIHHTRAVRRATSRALVVADMPFGTYHADISEALRNAVRIIKETGAEAVKVEGGERRGMDVIDYPHLGKRYLLLHEGPRGVSFYEMGEPVHPFGPADPPK